MEPPPVRPGVPSPRHRANASVRGYGRRPSRVAAAQVWRVQQQRRRRPQGRGWRGGFQQAQQPGRRRSGRPREERQLGRARPTPAAASSRRAGARAVRATQAREAEQAEPRERGIRRELRGCLQEAGRGAPPPAAAAATTGEAQSRRAGRSRRRRRKKRRRFVHRRGGPRRQLEQGGVVEDVGGGEGARESRRQGQERGRGSAAAPARPAASRDANLDGRIRAFRLAAAAAAGATEAVVGTQEDGADRRHPRASDAPAGTRGGPGVPAEGGDAVAAAATADRG